MQMLSQHSAVAVSSLDEVRMVPGVGQADEVEAHEVEAHAATAAGETVDENGFCSNHK